MGSKPKSKTYIVHHRGKSLQRGYTVLGRYKVGARNEKEAAKLLRETVGKHAKVQVYYVETKNLVAHGVVQKDVIN